MGFATILVKEKIIINLTPISSMKKDLTKKENWDEDLRYVARSRLIIGLVVGVLLGLYTRLFF